MRGLELTIPPPIVAAATGVIMWGLSRAFPAPGISFAGSLIVATILVLAGVAVAGAGLLAFRRAGTTPDPRRAQEASSLVTSGVYGRTRNPMYLGVFMMLLGWGLYLGSVVALGGSLLYVAYINQFQIAPEERILTKKFGAAYASYKASVRRWI